MIYDVKITGKSKFIFPEICVVCEKENPGNTVSLDFIHSKFSSVNVTSEAVSGTVPPEPNGQLIINRIPVCAGCEDRLKRKHQKNKKLILWLWILAGIAVAFILFSPLAWIWRLLIIVILLFIPILFSAIFPPPLDVVLTKNSAIFYFTSGKAAERFRTLNLSD
ncbi:MAG: hypothetical protein N2747_02115 [Chitinophagaceae bacterium]|nr:hypothetical protein [Chitinophagaceae bacterium]